MLSGNTTLFQVKSFDFKTKHLLVVLVLAIAFSTAFIIRSYPIKYGFALNEFDPYFDYRATKYIIDNGFQAYLNWHDYESWYPEGRDVPKTSQVALHLIAATTYKIFGFGSSLLDFVILFPVVIGSLTTIIIFALVRNLGGTSAGLIASLLFAFMPAIIQRGNLGWFKSEPLGLFLGLLSVYLFISSIKHNNLKWVIPKAIGAGLILGLANSSWGGIQYFSIPLAIFFFVIPFLRRDSIFIYGIIIFTVVTLLTAGAFPRPGISFIIGLPGIAMIVGMIFAIVGTIINKKSSTKNINRNLVAALAVFVLIGISIFVIGAYQPSSFRYLVAVNPFLSSHNPLVESVAEHTSPTVVDYFTDYSILLIFAGFGVWVAFSKRTDMTVFALIIGITGLYVSATFARLMVYSSIAIVILASIGIYELTRNIMQNRIENPKISEKELRKNIKEGKILPAVKPIVKVVFVTVIVFLISIPLVDYNGLIYPKNFNWISSADIPSSIVNGATGFRMQVEDWVDALNWISEKTPKDSVIASWWDYGYWITTLGNRTTLADNATINQTRIASIAQMLMSEPEKATKLAQDLKADYVLVYIVADRHSGPNGNSFYTLGSGGDESKKQWFMRIGGFTESDYVEDDGFTPNSNFWNNTLLGKLIPFTPISYASFGNGVLTNIQPEYASGTIALNLKDIKYPINGTNDQPFKLVYASPSFEDETEDIVFGVLIYEVNKNYKPKPVSIESNINTNDTKDKDSNKTEEASENMIKANMTPSDDVAILKTSMGNITVEFFPEAAPQHVNSFLNLSKKGFYDGTVFHRIVKDFVIQGGDPNTKNSNQGTESWGTGGPNFTINAEFSDIPHKRGILSMARTADPNSAGSQFFIVTRDSTFLDNQYTVFGRVIDGMDVVDKIAALNTNPSDQPIDVEKAKIEKIIIENRTKNS